MLVRWLTGGWFISKCLSWGLFVGNCWLCGPPVCGTPVCCCGCICGRNCGTWVGCCCCGATCIQMEQQTQQQLVMSSIYKSVFNHYFYTSVCWRTCKLRGKNKGGGGLYFLLTIIIEPCISEIVFFFKIWAQWFEILHFFYFSLFFSYFFFLEILRGMSPTENFERTHVLSPHLLPTDECGILYI